MTLLLLSTRYWTFFFFFPSRHISGRFFGWLFSSQISGEKKTHTFVNGSTGAHRTRAKIQDLPKTTRTFGLLFAKVRNLRSCVIISLFQCRIDFWRIVLLDIDLTPPILRILGRNLSLGVPWDTWNRLVQPKKKKRKKRVFFLRKRLTIIDHFEWLWSVGTWFRR